MESSIYKSVFFLNFKVEPYSFTNKIKSIRLYVKWVDDGIATMDNAADTNSTKITDTSHTHAENSLKVTASFVQI